MPRRPLPRLRCGAADCGGRRAARRSRTRSPRPAARRPSGRRAPVLRRGAARPAGRGHACHGATPSASASRPLRACRAIRDRGHRPRPDRAPAANGSAMPRAPSAAAAPSTTSSRACGSRNASTNARPGEPSGNCASGAERDVAVLPVTVTRARSSVTNSLRTASGCALKTSSARRPIAPSSPPRSS